MNGPTELETVLRASLLYEKLKKEVFAAKCKQLPRWFIPLSPDEWIGPNRELKRDRDSHRKQHERD